MGLAGGDTNRAKAYVRVQPLQGTFIELQFWIFYPWNDSGKSRIDVVPSVPDYIDADPTGTMGRHYSDWESVRVRVSNRNVWNASGYTLQSLVRSYHSFEEEVAGNDARLQRSPNGNPIVYVAKDSHAHYLSAGRHVYETPKDDNIVTVDLYDLTGNGPEFNTSQASKHIIVSSAWPSVATTRPDWLFFGGLWGEYLLNQFTVTVEDITGIDLYSEYQREVGNGKPGLLRRGVWAVVRPENANLGTLRTSAGPITPAFSPLVTNYSATVESGISQITVTPQAEDYTARIYVRLNGSTFTNGSGPLLGKASVPINLNPGANVISIIVNSISEGAVTAERIYTLTVTRQSLSTVVVNTNDAGAASLRQTIADVPAGTQITFAPNLSGQTIVLGGTQLVLNKNLTIDASALLNPVRISGNNAARVLQIASNNTVTLRGLFVTRGNSASGGGIENLGTLLLSQVSVVSNSSSGRGGGIYNGGTGTLTINNSTLSGNVAADIGGAIVNEGSLALDHGKAAALPCRTRERFIDAPVRRVRSEPN
jgi:hypothetical protein